MDEALTLLLFVILVGALIAVAMVLGAVVIVGGALYVIFDALHRVYWRLRS